MYSLKHRITKFVLLFCIIMMPTIGDFLAQGTTETAWDAKFSPNGQYIAVAISTGSIIIYDDSGNIIQTLSGHSDATIAIAWSPDGNTLASGGLDEFVRLWDTQTWSMTNELEVSSNEIYNLSWKPDGSVLVGSSFDTLFIWDTSTWSLLTNPMNVSLTDLVWSPDGSSFAFAGTPTFIGIATLTGSDIEIQTFAGHLSTPYGVAWNSDGEKMASAGGLDGTIRLWDVNNNLEIASIFNNGETITDVVFLNSQFIAASTEQGSLYTINTLDNSITDTQTLGHSINAIDWNASTEELIVAGDYEDNAGGNNSTITIVDVPPSSIPTATPMPTPENTPTTPPTTGDFTVTSRLDGQDDNQQAIFTYTLTNSSSTPQANLYMRLFFSVDNGRIADDYLLEAYYDSSNALLITGPFQWDANNHYFILSYGASALAPNANYQFQGVLRLSDWGTDFSSANDWWHTGISTQDNQTDYLPVYAGGVLNTGSEPSGAPQSTNTSAPTNTPDDTAVLQVENRTDGVDNNQQVSFRYRLTNISTQAQGNLSTRIYFTLDGSEVASDYVLEQYYDQSGVASVSGPTLASGDTYYFQVDYGATSLQPNNSWEFQGALHLVNYVENFDSSNDWWHTGIGSTYQETTYLPTYINSTLEVGQEP